jgi:sulfur-oxidizing protein SoxY
MRGPLQNEEAMMDIRRRQVVRAGAGVLALAWGSGVLRPGAARAADAWNKQAFAVKTLDDVVKALGGTGATESKDIRLDAPDIAENGAVVPLSVESKIPKTTTISLLILKNPNALSADFTIPDGTDPYVSTRVKMGETSSVIALVSAGGRYYYTSKEVKVTLGGCGG